MVSTSCRGSCESNKGFTHQSLTLKRYFENTVIPRMNSVFVLFGHCLDSYQARRHTFTQPLKVKPLHACLHLKKQKRSVLKVTFLASSQNPSHTNDTIKWSHVI